MIAKELLQTNKRDEALKLLKNSKYLELVNNKIKNHFEKCINLIESKYNFHSDLSQIILDFVDPKKFTQQLVLDGNKFDYSPDGNYVVIDYFGNNEDNRYEIETCTTGGIRIFNVNSGDFIKNLEGSFNIIYEIKRNSGWVEHRSRKSVMVISWSPNGLYIAGAIGGEILIWNAKSGKLILKFKAHNGTTSNICWSDDSLQIASVGNDCKAKVWTLNSEEKFEFKYDTTLASVIWIDNNILAIRTTKGEVYVEDLDSHVTLMSFKDPEKNYAPVYLDYSKGKLAFNSENTIRLFDTKEFNELKPLIGHAGKIKSFNFNSDGSKIVSISEDRTIKIWDTCTGKILEKKKIIKKVNILIFIYLL